MREVDEQELLSMLRNLIEGASGELEKLQQPKSALEHEAKGYYEGRIDAWVQLHKRFLRELSGEALAPRFFQPLSLDDER